MWLVVSGTAVSLGWRRYFHSFPERRAQCRLMCRVSKPVASTAARARSGIRRRWRARATVRASRASAPFFEEPAGRLLEGRVVGDAGQARGRAEVGPVAEDHLQAAVVDLEELAQGQQGEDPVLGVAAG